MEALYPIRYGFPAFSPLTENVFIFLKVYRIHSRTQNTPPQRIWTLKDDLEDVSLLIQVAFPVLKLMESLGYLCADCLKRGAW